jgi:hypothetical protein
VAVQVQVDLLPDLHRNVLANHVAQLHQVVGDRVPVAHLLIARQAVAQHQVATQLIVAVQQNELQVVQQLQPVVRALSAHIQNDQVAMMNDQVAMMIVRSALGQVNDLKQVMIADQQADQVQADHQVAAQVLIVHAVMMIDRVLTDLIQIVHAVMMIVQNALVTKNQNVVNGQANDLKQVMIDDQQVDQVQADHQLADQVQIARTQIVHDVMMIVHVPTGLIQIVHVVMMIVRNVLVTKNQNVVNGQANDLKQVMIADQQVDQV